MKYLSLTLLLSLVASAQQPPLPSAATTTESDSAKIYSSFLIEWNGKDPINVSKTAELPTPQDVQDYTKCVKDGESREPEWLKSEAVSDLSAALGSLDGVTLVDPRKWHPKDPGDLISKGQSVESAVDAGFAAGLLTFSAITFDKSRDTAAFTYAFTCGHLCGNGGTLIFKRTTGGWSRAKYSCGNWISETRGDRQERAAVVV